jgi:hypothetical protein
VKANLIFLMPFSKILMGVSELKILSPGGPGINSPIGRLDAVVYKSLEGLETDSEKSPMLVLFGV